MMKEYWQIFSKGLLQLIMELAHIGNPLRIPYLLKHLIKLTKVW